MSDDPWTAHMRAGNFAAAWEVSDAVLTARRATGFPPVWDQPRHLQPIWNGEPLDGKRIMVRCYHGLGDTVQFIRYAPRLRAVAREVIVWVQPGLVPLVRTVPGVDRVLPLHDGAPETEFDADLEIMELPHVFRSTVGTLPATVPYLHVEPDTGLPRAPGRRAVGLVWESGAWDPRRSVPAALLAETLGEISGVDWHLLQRGPALGAMPRGFGIDSGSDDPTEAACTMRALDLVISVDSFPAHLAGALGVPVWTLLPWPADWRWLEGRTDNPWYPTMRLFRQDPARQGDWRPVLAEVAAALGGFGERRRGG